MPEEREDPPTLYCSFCGKSQHEVKKLIAGPIVLICNECVVLCVGIIVDDAYTLDDLKADLEIQKTTTITMREETKASLQELIEPPKPGPEPAINESN